MADEKRNALNRENDVRSVRINDKNVVLDLLNDNEFKEFCKYEANMTTLGSKPFKAAKVIDGDPEFKGYRTNKFF